MPFLFVILSGRCFPRFWYNIGMKLLTVIPISKGIPKAALTYFSSENIEAGSIVAVPLRKKTGYGLVTGVRDAKDLKTEIKNLPYAMRKVEGLKARSFLLPAFIRAVRKTADYFAASPGSVLWSLLPAAVLEESGTLSFPEREDGSFHEVQLLQCGDEERYGTYKSLIREEFARGRSVFFCVPTGEDLENARTSLEKGIEAYTFVLHGGLSKKETVSLWRRAVAEDHPVLIIATGTFLSVPRGDIGTIIVEKESSRSYKTQSRPYLDFRVVALFLARETSRRLIFGDTLLRIETLWEEKNSRYATLSPLQFRSLSPATTRLISMRKPADMRKKEFALLSNELSETLLSARDRSERVFLFAGRKGLFPTTVCSDCGTVVTCRNCGAPAVLYSGKRVAPDMAMAESGNLFVCHHCGERRDAGELCVHCKGWRLMPLGVGTERVEREVKKLLPDSDIFRLDGDSVSTRREATRVRDAFFKSPGGVLIGTELAVAYLSESVEHSAVVSLDSFFSVPDFRIHEKIFHILLDIRAKTEKQMIVQTRREDTTIFTEAMAGNLAEFYRSEIEDRKSVGYPPFSTHIKLTLSGTTRKEMPKIVEFLRPYDVAVFEGASSGKTLTHGLITLPAGAWVDPELLSKLRELPSECEVRVDPDTLL